MNSYSVWSGYKESKILIINNFYDVNALIRRVPWFYDWKCKIKVINWYRLRVPLWSNRRNVKMWKRGQPRCQTICREICCRFTLLLLYKVILQLHPTIFMLLGDSDNLTISVTFIWLYSTMVVFIEFCHQFWCFFSLKLYCRTRYPSFV